VCDLTVTVAKVVVKVVAVAGEVVVVLEAVVEVVVVGVIVVETVATATWREDLIGKDDVDNGTTRR
jgi:ribosomal protein L10